MNLSKTHSLYKSGMKPVVFSLSEFKRSYPDHVGDPLLNKDGWQRACNNIKYFQNDLLKSDFKQKGDKYLKQNTGSGEGADNYFTLSFDYRFQHPGDEVWFAHAVPSTFTELQRGLLLMQNPDIVRTEILCTSLAGLPVPLLTITENIKTYQTYSEFI